MASYTYFVSKGQNQGSLKLYYQTMFVESGGLATGIIIDYGGRMGVDGIAQKTTVSANGTLNIFRGTAATVNVENGRINISSGGSAYSTVFNGGEMYIINGKSLQTTLNGGVINVGYSSGNRNPINAVAENTEIRNGGIMNVSSGGKALNTTVSKGTLNVSNAGNAVSNTIRNGGQMFVSSAGSASDTAIASGGTMTLTYGASHYGKLNIARGGKVIAEYNSTIYFSLSGKKPSNEYLISNLSQIEGNPDYCITIAANQTAGIYKLAANGTAISNICISVGSNNYYTDVDSAGLFIGKNYCDLLLDEENNLYFVIASPPPAPKINASNTKLTNQNITLTASPSEDCVVQYSLDNDVWLDYTAPIVVEKNGIYYFRNKNKYNLYSETATFIIANIDKENPQQTVTLSPHPKNFNVTAVVSAADNSGIASVQYKLSDDESAEWLTYDKKNGLKITSDCTLLVKTTDKAGNFIISSAVIDVAQVPQNNWTDMKNSGGFSSEIGRTADYSKENPNIFTVSGWVGIDDAIDYHEITLTDAGRYSFDIYATDKTKFTVYKLNSKTNKNGIETYSIKSLQSTTLKYDKLTDSYYAATKGLLLEEGTYYIAVQSTNAAKGGSSDYSVTVNSNTEYFAESKNGKNDDWSDMKTEGDNSETLGHADYQNISNWVGFGDSIDYFEVTLTDAGRYNFDISATDKTKFTVYKLNSKTNRNGIETYSIKSLQSTTLKYDKPTDSYYAATKGLLLEEGTYYIAVQSTNAAKGGSSDYSVTVNSNTEYFAESKNGKNDDWSDMKTEGDNSETLGHADYQNISGWVGFGDNIDYQKITLDEVATLNFSVTATGKTKFSIYQLNSKTDKNGNTTYSLKLLQSTTLKYDKNKETYEAVTKDLLLEASSYYIAVESSDAKKGGNSYYSAETSAFEVHLSAEKAFMSDNSDDTWKLAADKEAVNAVNNWVGFGDAADYFKFEVAENGRISFICTEQTSEAISAKELKISCLDAKGKSVSLVSENNSFVSKNSLAAGTYYIGIQSTNAKKFHNEYNIAIEFGSALNAD